MIRFQLGMGNISISWIYYMLRYIVVLEKVTDHPVLMQSTEISSPRYHLYCAAIALSYFVVISSYQTYKDTKGHGIL